MRSLRIAAQAVSSLVGPLHGTAYAAVIGCTVLMPTASPGARWQAVIPEWADSSPSNDSANWAARTSAVFTTNFRIAAKYR